MSVMVLIRWFFQLFWIGICAVAMVFQTHLLLGQHAPVAWLTGFVFGATVFGYNFSAVRHRRWPAWALGGVAACCFWRITTFQQAMVVVPALIWGLYYGLPSGGRYGWRRYPAAKPLAIAVAWAWVTVLLPLPLLQWTGAAALFVGRAAFIFALALAYDLCDQAYDRHQGLNTLVLQLGPGRSLRLIDAAFLMSAVCIGLNFLFGYYSGPAALALIFSLAVSRQSIRYLAPLRPWGDWRKVAIDGLMVLQMLLVWIAVVSDL